MKTFSPSVTLAQIGDTGAGTAIITGIIHDIHGDVLEAATIAIYADEAESDLVTGRSSDENGEFHISIAPGDYILKITFISYEPWRMELAVGPDEVFNTGIITLEESSSEMDEVVIEGERSFMEMNFDRLTFHVQQDITSLGGDALDVLDNVPSLETDFDGNVFLRGSDGVNILINGRPSSLLRSGTDGLHNIPAHMIKRVEIITNPSARYEAEGTAGIINIVLIDNAEFGFNGSVALRSSLPHDHRISGNANYHVRSVNWFADANYRYRNRPRGDALFEQSFRPDTSYMYERNRDVMNLIHRYQLRVGADIFLPHEQSLTVSSRVSIRDYLNTSVVSYLDYTWEGDLIRNLNRDDLSDDSEYDLDFRMNYENRFNGDRRHRLTADANIGVGWETERSNLLHQIDQQNDPSAAEHHEIMDTSNDQIPLNQRINGEEDYFDYRARIDYERPLGSGGRFETGIRSRMDYEDNRYLVEEQREGDWVVLPAYQDNFTYRRMINSAYGVISGRLEPISWQIGLRAEQTDVRMDLSLSDHATRQSYFNVFPGMSVSWQITNRRSVQISYSRRLSRPSASRIMPFSGYSDSRNIYRGNPDLQPVFSNTIETGYLRRWDSGSVLTSLYYRYRTGVIETISLQEINVDGNPVTVRHPINLSTENALGIEISGNQDVWNNLRVNGSINYSLAESEGMYQDEMLSSSSTRFQSRFRARWQFLGNWNFYSDLRYRGPRSTTQGRSSSQHYINAGLAKTFFNRTLVMSVEVRDVFNTRLQDQIIDEPGFYSESMRTYTNRVTRINIRYRF